MKQFDEMYIRNCRKQVQQVQNTYCSVTDVGNSQRWNIMLLSIVKKLKYCTDIFNLQISRGLPANLNSNSRQTDSARQIPLDFSWPGLSRPLSNSVQTSARPKQRSSRITGADFFDFCNNMVDKDVGYLRFWMKTLGKQCKPKNLLVCVEGMSDLWVEFRQWKSRDGRFKLPNINWRGTLQSSCIHLSFYFCAHWTK